MGRQLVRDRMCSHSTHPKRGFERSESLLGLTSHYRASDRRTVSGPGLPWATWPTADGWHWDSIAGPHGAHVPCANMPKGPDWLALGLDSRGPIMVLSNHGPPLILYHTYRSQQIRFNIDLLVEAGRRCGCGSEARPFGSSHREGCRRAALPSVTCSVRQQVQPFGLNRRESCRSGRPSCSDARGASTGYFAQLCESGEVRGGTSVLSRHGGRYCRVLLLSQPQIFFASRRSSRTVDSAGRAVSH